MTTTCGLWLTTRQLTAVVVENDDGGRIAARYSAARGSEHTWDLLTRVAGENGLECRLVVPYLLLRETSVAPWMHHSGLTIWVVPQPVVVAVSCLTGPPYLARNMAAVLARLPRCQFFRRHLRRHETQLPLF